MNELLTEAMGLVVTAERTSFALYRKVAATATDPEGRVFFERLAQEQHGHISALLTEFPSAGCPGAAQMGQFTAGEAHADEASARGTFEQLRLALLDKRFCIDLYETFLKSFREPLLCRLFQKALEAARRTHPGNSLHLLSPNRHSQLFSMLDSGRQSQLG